MALHSRTGFKCSMKKIILFPLVIILALVFPACEKWDLERNNQYDGHQSKVPVTNISWNVVSITDEDIEDHKLNGGENFAFTLTYKNSGNMDIESLSVTPITYEDK